MSNPSLIPKSLHTVTVLVTVARMLMRQGQTPARALDNAVLELGYIPDQDGYKLIDQAFKKLTK